VHLAHVPRARRRRRLAGRRRLGDRGRGPGGGRDQVRLGRGGRGALPADVRVARVPPRLGRRRPAPRRRGLRAPPARGHDGRRRGQHRGRRHASSLVRHPRRRGRAAAPLPAALARPRAAHAEDERGRHPGAAGRRLLRRVGGRRRLGTTRQAPPRSARRRRGERLRPTPRPGLTTCSRPRDLPHPAVARKGGVGMRRAALVLLALLAPAAAHAEMRLPPGFSAEVYVTGSGEAPDGRAAVGIPSTTSLAFDAAGMLYTARSGRRYRGGEIEDLWPLFRFPAGGARVTGNVARYFYGPPLLNLQLGALRGQELLVTTFDRDLGLGVLYRIVDGRAELLAGGTPPPGEPPLFKQPEGVA